jgi:hypothetical protein
MCEESPRMSFEGCRRAKTLGYSSKINIRRDGPKSA